MKLKKTTITWLVIIGVIVIIGLWVAGSYNGLVTAKAGVDAQWSNVETTYQRRADLIPNLVAIVNKSANFQKETLVEVTRMRSAWQQASAAGDRAGMIEASQGLDSALARLLVTVESYPDLDVEAFNSLMAETSGTENRINTERIRYNDMAKTYNIKVKRFPTNAIAGMFNFEAQPYLCLFLCMRSHTNYLTLHTKQQKEMVNITRQVEDAVKKSGVQEGLCLVNSMHITSSVFINDEESGLKQDFLEWLEELAPEKLEYRHHQTGEDNADAHLKRTIMGRDVVVAITKGRLDFGPWEQIFYGEFDGQRDKRVLIKIIGDS